MKRKFEKQYQEVAVKVAKMLSQNPTENEAVRLLMSLPRKDRRLVQRFAQRDAKLKHEEPNPEN